MSTGDKFDAFLKEAESLDNHGWYISYSNQDSDSTYNLPFNPGQNNLDHKTLSLNATHPSTKYRLFDTHNLMGHLQCKATFEGMSVLDKL